MSAPASVAIATVRWRPFRLPLRHRFETAHGPLEGREGVLLELRDAGGGIGIGEASPMPSLGAGGRDDVLRLLEQHAPALAGTRPGAAGGDAAGAEVAGVLPAEGPGAAALRCAVDVALLDLEARRRGLPVVALLSEQPARSVLSNAVIGDGGPEQVAARGREALAAGYSALKLKVGAGALEHDTACVRALRESCPDAVLRLDANGAWTERVASEAIDEFARLGVELLEQPVPASEVEALARLRERSSLCIAADEAVASERTAARVLERRAADVLVLKPMLLGGVRPALELARRAAAAGIGAFATTTFDSSVGIAAALQLAAALPWDGAQGLGTGDHLDDDIVVAPLRPAAGRLEVPGPGLGVTVDPAALERLATGGWSEVAA